MNHFIQRAAHSFVPIFLFLPPVDQIFVASLHLEKCFPKYELHACLFFLNLFLVRQIPQRCARILHSLSLYIGNKTTVSMSNYIIILPFFEAKIFISFI